MGKTRRGHKERSREQELKHENQKLRREVSSLRKQLARIDLDRYSHIQKMVQEHLSQEEEIVTTQDALDSMKNEWKCFQCADGYLEAVPFPKAGETWYYRQCVSCPNRTKSQLYTPNIKGIVRVSTPDKNKK